MKEHGILNAHFNIPNDTITIVDSEGTLILHPNQYVPNTTVHYKEQFKEFKEINSTAINVAKDLNILLNLLTKLPLNPPMRDKSIFTKKEYFRKALIEHVRIIHRNNTEFQFFKSALHVEINQIENRSKSAKVSIKQKGLMDSFNDITKELAENIYFSVNGEINEQINKKLSR
jgi:mRNA-degrading endonuclease YafQ of YafQ-DinJ toxin-antitoxin module